MGNIFKKLRDVMPARRKHTNELKQKLIHMERMLYDISNGICDNSSIGKLELMLTNAHIPMEYRDIFYKMFAMTRKSKVCAYSANTLNLDFIHKSSKDNLNNQNDTSWGGNQLSNADANSSNQILSHIVNSSSNKNNLGDNACLDKNNSNSNKIAFYHNNSLDEYKTIQPPVCIDCGAHAGLVTDIILFCGGMSYTFEPNIYLYDILQSKYDNNKNVILSQTAVSNRFYKTEFLMDCKGIFSQGNRIVGSIDSTHSMHEVQVVDLSEIIEKHILPEHKRIYFLKLDVEGAEFDIMNSILEKKLYKHIDYIACETHERFFSDGKTKIKNLKNTIKEHGADNVLLDWF